MFLWRIRENCPLILLSSNTHGVEVMKMIQLLRVTVTEIKKKKTLMRSKSSLIGLLFKVRRHAFIVRQICHLIGHITLVKLVISSDMLVRSVI